MQNSVNHAPGLKCKVCPRLLSEVIEQLASEAGPSDKKLQSLKGEEVLTADS